LCYLTDRGALKNLIAVRFVTHVGRKIVDILGAFVANFSFWPPTSPSVKPIVLTAFSWSINVGFSAPSIDDDWSLPGAGMRAELDIYSWIYLDTGAAGRQPVIFSDGQAVTFGRDKDSDSRSVAHRRTRYSKRIGPRRDE
jgi:hypothetical protein